MRRSHIALLTVAILIALAAPAAAQTYFPFGSVVIGTSGTGIRVGPIGCVQQTATAALTTDGNIAPVQCDENGWLKVAGLVSVADLETLATAANQPGFGVAGTAHANVLTVQGITGSTPVRSLLTDPSGTALTLASDATAGVTAATSGPQGMVMHDAVLSALAETDGEATQQRVDGLGRAWTRRGDPCADHARITSAVINESTAATNEIVALAAGETIHVCSYKWVTTLANSLNWARGTGTDCATGLTALEGPQPYGANGGVTESGGGSALFTVTAANALCLTSAVATAHGGRVSYVRTAAP